MFPVSGAGVPKTTGAEPVAAEDLVQQGQLELAEAGTAELLVEEQRPQAAVLDLLLKRVGQRPGLGIAGIRRAREHQLKRFDFGAAELRHPVQLLLKFRLGGKVPRHEASSSSVG